MLNSDFHAASSASNLSKARGETCHPQRFLVERRLNISWGRNCDEITHLFQETERLRVLPEHWNIRQVRRRRKTCSVCREDVLIVVVVVRVSKNGQGKEDPVLVEQFTTGIQRARSTSDFGSY